MNDPLTIYLRDHLAGSQFAITLLESLQDEHRDNDLGDFARSLRALIEQDQAILLEIISHVGKTSLDLAEAAGWIAEKASRLKLRREAGEGLGTFEALETIALGIRGKWELWRALSIIRNSDARIPDHDFDQLAARANDQYVRAEEKRVALIPATFGPARAA